MTGWGEISRLRFAPLGMPGGGEIGCWEGVFHGGMVAGEGDYSQWEYVRVGGWKGVAGAQRDSSTSLRCAQNDMWGALRSAGNDVWGGGRVAPEPPLRELRVGGAALRMPCGRGKGGFRPYGSDMWGALRCGGNEVRGGGRAVPEPPLRVVRKVSASTA